MAKFDDALGIHDRPDGERKYYEMPMRYSIGTDELIPVTQEWVNFAERQFRALGQARAEAKRAIGIQDDIVINCHPALQAFLDAWRPEFEQKPKDGRD